MTAATLRTRTTKLTAAFLATPVVGGLALVQVLSASPALAIATAPPLGTSAQYAVLAGAGVTNTGTTTVTTQDASVRGDIGTSPTDTITGDTSINLPSTGSFHRADENAAQAQSDSKTGYGVAAGAASDANLSPQLDKVILTPGVYTGDSLDLAVNGTLTLDASGSPDAVFLIKVNSSLTLNSGSDIALKNGAQACHVFWQVSEDATIGTTVRFRGTLLAKNAIVAKTGATIEGRLLAQNAAVTLDSNVFTLPSCSTGSGGTGGTGGTGTGGTGTGGTGTGGTGTGGTGTGTTSGGTTSGGTTGATGGSPSPSTRSDDSDDDDDNSGSAARNRSSNNSKADNDNDNDSASDSDGSSGLPDTGGPSNLLLAGALALMIAGGSFVMAARQRRRGAHRG